MRTLIFGFLMGVVFLQQQATLPSAVRLFSLFLFSALFLLAACWPRLRRIQFLLRALSGAFFGIAWAACFALLALSSSLPKQWEGKDVVLIGTVSQLPQPFDRGARFHFDVEQVLSNEEIKTIPSRVALSWYSGFDKKTTHPIPQIKVGERWQLTVRMKRPHGNANPYGFDYEAWLLNQGVRATGYVRTTHNAENIRLDRFVFKVGHVVGRVREWLRNRIQTALADKPYAGEIVALVIGDQKAIPSTHWALFKNTGVGHLFSISGLHVTLFAGLISAIAMALWRRSFFTRAQLPLIFPAQKAAILAAMVAAVFYVALAGFGIPAQRTLYMLLVIGASLWLGRISALSSVLSLALGVTVLIDPMSVMWPGFWLSFGAVSIILYVSVGRRRTVEIESVSLRKRCVECMKSFAKIQYAISIGLLPFMILLFGQVSIISPLANLFAIPIVSVLIAPFAIFGSFLPDPLFTLVLHFVHVFMQYLIEFIAWLSTFPFSVWVAPSPPIWAVLLALLGMIWLLAPRGLPCRYLGVFCLVPLFFTPSIQPESGDAWVTVFDVGQGSALLVETKTHRMLVDTGPAYTKDMNAAERVILPYLNGRGMRHIDRLIVTHGDNDHAGGVFSILDNYHVTDVFSSMNPSSFSHYENLGYTQCEAGQKWQWDGVFFEVLHPNKSYYTYEHVKKNALSCVIKLTAGKHSMLLTGDISYRQERAMVRRYGDDLRANILLAPHHGGSKTSTSEFLSAISPMIGVFQVGYRNRYGHPRARVLSRYEKAGIATKRTDLDGAIHLRLGSRLAVSSYRQTHARYWHDK